jgi:outer membrane receptor for ferrienterochelin and colicin
MQYLDVDARTTAAATLEIVLKPVASELVDVMVAANDQSRLREFYEHKAQRSSFARFLDQQEIRRQGATFTSDLFRTMPGITIKASSSGGNTIRIRGCKPMVWVDGQRIPDAELDEVASPHDIAGIEFYTSMAGTPAQYMDRTNRTCGTVLVWTRNR